MKSLLLLNNNKKIDLFLLLKKNDLICQNIRFALWDVKKKKKKKRFLMIKIQICFVIFKRMIFR